MGFPVAPDKVVGHSTTLTFLSIELDSITMVMRLPKSKLERLKASLCRWLCRSLAQKRQLQSIIGQLSNAAIIVWPGRTFLQSLIEMAKIPKKHSISFASMGNVRQTSIGGTPSWKVGTELPSSLVTLWVTPLLSMLPDPGVVVPSWKRGPPGSSFSGLYAGKE